MTDTSVDSPPQSSFAQRVGKAGTFEALFGIGAGCAVGLGFKLCAAAITGFLASTAITPVLGVATLVLGMAYLGVIMMGALSTNKDNEPAGFSSAAKSIPGMIIAGGLHANLLAIPVIWGATKLGSLAGRALDKRLAAPKPAP